MPRYPRFFLVGFPHHIVQRGHDRKPVFAHEADYRLYLENLHEQMERFSVTVFGYCLMTNHVHLLLQPECRGPDLSELMGVVAARQTRYTNRIERRSGTLWEGRFKSSIIDTDDYLLACCRYVELNPVRARMVRQPEDYPWSSHRERIGSDVTRLPLTEPGCYRELAADADGRCRRYRKYVAAGVPPDELELIRTAVNRNQLTGNDRFKAEIARKLGRRISDRAPGRPRKPDPSSAE